MIGWWMNYNIPQYFTSSQVYWTKTGGQMSSFMGQLRWSQESVLMVYAYGSTKKYWHVSKLQVCIRAWPVLEEVSLIEQHGDWRHPPQWCIPQFLSTWLHQSVVDPDASACNICLTWNNETWMVEETMVCEFCRGAWHYLTYFFLWRYLC